MTFSSPSIVLIPAALWLAGTSLPGSAAGRGLRKSATPLKLLARAVAQYKEMAYGILIGLGGWVLDAAMHAGGAGHLTLARFADELAAGNGEQLLFRILFVIVAIALGISLWRSKRRSDEWEYLRGTVDLLCREVANPLLLVVSYSHMLSLRKGWPVDQQTLRLAEEIRANATKVGQIITHLPAPGAVLRRSDADDANELQRASDRQDGGTAGVSVRRLRNKNGGE